MKAIIFDLDGVIVSTDILHHNSLIKAVYDVTRYDASLLPVTLPKSMMSTKEKLRKIQEYYHFSDNEYNKILKRKDELFFKGLQNIVIDDNVLECLNFLKNRKLLIAIASNTRLINIEKILDITNTGHFFNAIASAEEVPNRKPSPDVIYLSYKKLGLLEQDYAQTIFVEDSDEGVEAGNQTPSVVIKINNPTDLKVDLFKQWIK